jgi:hypothetical protein
VRLAQPPAVSAALQLSPGNINQQSLPVYVLLRWPVDMLLCCSIFSSIIDKLNLTTIWPLDCYWISAEICYNVGGLSYNETVAKTTDRCFPCAASSYGCSGPDGDGLFFCGQAENKFPAEYYGTNYCPGGCTFVGTPGNYTPPYMPPYMPTSGRRMLQQNSASSTPFATGGTRAFEGYAGTFALPNNNVSANWGGGHDVGSAAYAAEPPCNSSIAAAAAAMHSPALADACCMLCMSSCMRSISNM